MISLSEGSGGKEMDALIKRMRAFLNTEDQRWTNKDDDAAIWKAGNDSLVFTTDSYVIDPIFFPGGDIGKIAICGTINDIAVMGAIPSGISLAIVLEEGFSKQDLDKILASIGIISKQTGIPVVTGDTKVVEKGKIDKIMINTSAIGVTNTTLDRPLKAGDKIIASGTLGDHATAVLSKRFDFETDTLSDCKPLTEEIKAIKHLIKQARDPTRGGLSATLNGLAEKNKINMLINEKAIPLKKETVSMTDLLGLDPYNLACEGRFICITSREDAEQALETLRHFNPSAAIIGEVTENKTENSEVILDTGFGKRVMPKPSGNLVPRIC